MAVTLSSELSQSLSLPDILRSLLDLPDPVFLDSSMPHYHLGRYSYLAVDPLLVLRSRDGHLSVRHRDANGYAPPVPSVGDPFMVLQRLLRGHRAVRSPGLPPFQGGAVGYFGYDLAQHVEQLPHRAVDDMALPDLCVGLYDFVLAHDHRSQRSWLVGHCFDGDLHKASRRFGELRERIAAASCAPAEAGRRLLSARRSLAGKCKHVDAANRAPVLESAHSSAYSSACSGNFSREGYLRAIARAKDYIAAGDVYQVCLSQRFDLPYAGDPWQLYLRLREVSRVPYGAYLGFGDATIACGSPELFLRLEGDVVETRPIKGTRPRGRSHIEDELLIEDLATSEKERAENLMIVDLLRNDIGRVCRTGSVHVPGLFAVESFSTVHHLVSTVAGRLEPGHDAVDLLRACFPGGSVTGCPKIRAMQIIDELEPTRRGAYCGAIGFIGFDGAMDTNIVIRTIVIKDGRAYLQVGGAIVADSDPEAEYQETLDKAEAALLALAWDEQYHHGSPEVAMSTDAEGAVSLIPKQGEPMHIGAS